jgi:integrase/recombinase XerD
MNKIFSGPLARELDGFVQFKRSLGYGYQRQEFMLREFDRFLVNYAARNDRWQLAQAVIAWLSSKPGRKAISVSAEASVLKGFYRYLRRSSRTKRIAEPIWPHLPYECFFIPYSLSKENILKLLALCVDLKGPRFRAVLYRALILVLYCTGIRFGEALRLRMRDMDTQSAVLFIDMFKGRTRWVPFHRSLARELKRYLTARVAYAPSDPDTRFFVGVNKTRLPVVTAGNTLRGLYTKAGLKPDRGRIGPRPYDLRHAFAVHRLSQWYREGTDLHSRLPWLSAYMGHTDIVGTETYLNTTPELLELAGKRLRRRFERTAGQKDSI